MSSPSAIRFEMRLMAYSASVGEVSKSGGRRTLSGGGNAAITGIICQYKQPMINRAILTMYFVGRNVVNMARNDNNSG